MPAVPLQCPTCAGLIQIDTSLAGQPVGCPLCHSGMIVPPEQTLWEMLAAAGGMAPAAPSHDQPLTLGCPACAGPFQVLAGLVGQQVACPHCGAPVIVPAQPIAAGAAEATAAVEAADADSLLPPGVSPPSIAPPPASPPEATPPARVAEKRRTAGPREPARDLLPPSADDLLPPGMGGRPPTKRAASPPVRQDERLPPSPPTVKTGRSTGDDSLPSVAPGEAPRVPPDRADRLPPGVAPNSIAPSARIPAHQPAPAESDPSPASAAPIDDLLPPGAASVGAAPTTVPTAAPTQAALVDALLPPGASPGAPAVASRQVAIPKAPQRLPGQLANLPAGAIVVPTPDGGFVTVKETPKTIGEGEEEIELRRLSAAEKSSRKFRKNLMLGGFCLLIIVIVLVILLR